MDRIFNFLLSRHSFFRKIDKEEVVDNYTFFKSIYIFLIFVGISKVRTAINIPVNCMFKKLNFVYLLPGS